MSDEDEEGAALSKLETMLLTLKPSDLPQSVSVGVRGSRAQEELAVSLAKVRKCVLAGMGEGAAGGRGRGGERGEEDHNLLEPEEVDSFSASPLANGSEQKVVIDENGKTMHQLRR